MSTTRHHINRQRRLAAAGQKPRPNAPAGGASTSPAAGKAAEAQDEAAAGSAPGRRERATRVSARLRSRRPAREGRPAAGRRARSAPVAVLGALVVLLGAFAGWAHAEASGLRDEPAAQNVALSDSARTSELKGRVNDIVGALFSYDYADTAKARKAADSLLTGKAVGEHRDLLADIRAQAEKQKLVIDTTVTDSGVERITGDRARVLVYADQSSVSAAGAKDKTQNGGKDAAKATGGDEATYAGAMFALDLVQRDGHWLVSGIDTFTR